MSGLSRSNSSQGRGYVAVAHDRAARRSPATIHPPTITPQHGRGSRGPWRRREAAPVRGDEAGAILGKRREGGSRRSATSRSHPTAARCSLLLTALICQDCPGVHYYTDSLIDQYLSDPPLPILEYTSDQSRRPSAGLFVEWPISNLRVTYFGQYRLPDTGLFPRQVS